MQDGRRYIGGKRMTIGFSYERARKLLRYLLAKSKPVTAKRLADKFGITERTLRTDIQNLNHILEHTGARIVHNRGRGYILEAPSIEELCSILADDEATVPDTANKRIHFLILALLYSQTCVSIEQMEEFVYAGAQTIARYLKTIRCMLEDYSLQLGKKPREGYYILGEEFNKRQCMIGLLDGENIMEREEIYLPQMRANEWEKISLTPIRQIVLKFSEQRCESFSDYNLRTLLTVIAICCSRIKAGFTLASYHESGENASQHEIQYLLKDLADSQDIIFSNAEKEYIGSAYIRYTTDFSGRDEERRRAGLLSKDILERIYQYYRIDIRRDPILLGNISRHLCCVIRSQASRLNKRNPLLEHVRQNYLLFYEMTETAVYDAFLSASLSITSDEIGFLSFHIGAAIKREMDKRQLADRCRVMIVTDAGAAVAGFIQSELESIFAAHLHIVGHTPRHRLKRNLENVDLIISTIPVWNGKIPVIETDIPLSGKNMEEIFNFLVFRRDRNDDPYPLFRMDCFWRLHGKTKEEIIGIMGERLRERGVVSEEFTGEVIRREARISTAMNDMIAIPHPLEVCSYTNTVAVAVLDEPVAWDERHVVQIVFMLALTDGCAPVAQQLYNLLTDLMSEKSRQEKLLSCKTMEEVIDVLKGE